VSLRYRVDDLAPEASVTIVVKNVHHKTVKAFTLGSRATKEDLGCRPRRGRTHRLADNGSGACTMGVQWR
jgi:hypothetical protein